MGCGASVKGSVVEKDSGDADDEPVATTWATKTEVPKSMSDLTVNPQRGWQRGDQSSVQLVDADVESEIEIICEGKHTQAQQKNSAANGQEAPEAVETEFKPRPKPALSKQQQEEAAKLAEQRKRFDNQRYQQSIVSPKAGVSPAGGGGPSPQSIGPPRHEMVMGLNLTDDSSQSEDRMSTDCLPGGIQGDTPRVNEPPPMKVKNRHDIFDDDDELLMKEILDSVDV